MSVTLPVSSRERVTVEITAFSDNGPTDPTSLAVDFALLPVGDSPAVGDWRSGAWVTGTATPTASLLIGPGGVIAPAAGRYTLWMRVRGVVEQPERPIGAVRIV